MEDQPMDWEELQKERFLKDPEAKDRWERMALARAVAIAMIRYRARHGLSQRAVARKLGVPQSHIARLELGEHNPSIETLRWLAQGLGIGFVIGVLPSGHSGTLRLPEGAEMLTDTDAESRGLMVAVTG